MKKTGICLLLSALLAFSVTPGCALGGVRTAGEDIASRPESGLSLPAEEGTEDVNHPAAGWHQEEGKWYLLSDGERLTGWQTASASCYFPSNKEGTGYGGIHAQIYQSPRAV